MSDERAFEINMSYEDVALPVPDPDDVPLIGFTSRTYDFLSAIVDQCFAHPMRDFSRPSSIPFAIAAELFFLLRVMPDEVFPSGKWAIIQHLQTLIDAAASRHQR